MMEKLCWFLLSSFAPKRLPGQRAFPTYSGSGAELDWLDEEKSKIQSEWQSFSFEKAERKL